MEGVPYFILLAHEFIYAVRIARGLLRVHVRPVSTRPRPALTPPCPAH